MKSFQLMKHARLFQNILTTDINLYVDFVTQAYDWRFDGNIFKDDFSKNKSCKTYRGPMLSCGGRN